MYFFLVLLPLILPEPPLYAAILKRTVMMHVIEEEINGITFTHRIDTIDGQRKEVWVIDGEQVPEYEYLDRIAQQEALELKNQRQKESERIRKQQDFIAHEQRIVLKKIVHKQVHEIEKYLNKLSDMRLEPYLTFTQESFASQEDLKNFVQNELLTAQNLLSQDSELSFTQLEDALGLLQPYPDRLVTLYQHTLQAARERSDDTRLLKDLLHLVSESANA